MEAPLARTTAGAVRGIDDEGIKVFRGIPYAAPATGARRFGPPVPPEPWDAVLDATRRAPNAPQNPSMIEQLMGGAEQALGEDCLAVNVFTPGCDGAERPVLVWIHGGAFLTGNGSVPWFDGTRLARRDVVVVTCNYRLGALGYLHLSDIGPGFEGSGNAGLLDQVAALRWVRDNIGAFGGDPALVTVFGESAGAMSIGTLLGTPAASGLFRRAVLQSGAATHVHDAAAGTDVALALLEELGIAPADAPRLRDASVDEILAAQQRLVQATPFERGLPFMPVVDGTVLPRRPLDAVAAGAAAGVDLLVGTTAEEMKVFLLMEPDLAGLDEARLESRADALFVPQGRAPGAAMAVYRDELPDAPVPDLLSAVLTDHTFRMPAIRLSEAQVAHTPQVFMYEFGFRSPAFGGALGACHGIEIPFVFDNLDAPGAALFVGGATDAMRDLARRTADAWVAFARDGTPAADGLPAWPPYDLERRATLWFDEVGAEVRDDPGAAARRLWEGIEP